MPNNKKDRSGPRAKRKRRSEVLTAATRVFHAKGYHGTTIQDIADELGILKGSVYYYMTSKEDLLYEILEEVHETSFSEALQSVEVEGNPLQRIHSFISTLGEFTARNPAKMTVLLREINTLSPKRRKTIAKERNRYEEILRELITAGQEDGLVPDDLDPRITTMAIMGMVHSIHQWYTVRDSFKPAAIGQMYGDLAVCTLTGSSDPAQTAAGGMGLAGGSGSDAKVSSTP